MIDEIMEVADGAAKDPGAAVDMYFDKFLNVRFLDESKKSRAVVFYTIEAGADGILCARRCEGQRGAADFDRVFFPHVPFFAKKMLNRVLGFQVDEIFGNFKTSIFEFLNQTGFRLSFVPQKESLKIMWANRSGESGEVFRDEIKQIIRHGSTPQTPNLLETSNGND